MKRIVSLFIAAFIIAGLSCSGAMAKPEATEFRAGDFSPSALKSVLVLPLIYETTLPDSEPFLKESAEQKWTSLTTGNKTRWPFLVKTPQEVVKAAAFVKGVEPEPMNAQQNAEKALTLAADYTDGVLSCTVTTIGTGVIQHPGEYITKWRYEDRPVWRNNRWEKERVSIPYQEYKEPWNEGYTKGAVKLELRSSKDNSLLYGVNVSANTGEGLFSDAPSLSKHLQNVIENAAKRIPVK